MYVTESVKTKTDLQNLIANIILREVDDFTLDDIVRKTNTRLVGSPYHASEELKCRCSDTLETLFLIGSISHTPTGKYTLSMSWPAVSTR